MAGVGLVTATLPDERTPDMQIDGFVPADDKIALQEGVTFHYPTSYGDVTIIAKMAGDINEGFTQAFAKLSQRHDREHRLGNLKPEKQFTDIIRLYGEEVVIRWSTTIKSGGKAIEANLDNFVDLMASVPVRGVFSMFQTDCSDLANFRAKQEEDIAKN